MNHENDTLVWSYLHEDWPDGAPHAKAKMVVDKQDRAFFRSRNPRLYCEMMKAVKVNEFVGSADFCKRLMQSYPEHNQVKREFPKGTVLVGGHPRWQKFFAQGHSREMIL